MHLEGLCYYLLFIILLIILSKLLKEKTSNRHTFKSNLCKYI